MSVSEARARQRSATKITHLQTTTLSPIAVCASRNKIKRSAPERELRVDERPIGPNGLTYVEGMNKDLGDVSGNRNV